MSMMEFGFEESKVIKSQQIELFKQQRPGQVNRVCIVSFKKFHDTVLAHKAREKGAPLTDEEKAQYILKVDEKIAGNLKKEVKDLTEVDRLDPKSPKFAVTYTHYKDGIGTIRCLSKYQGSTLVKPELCCEKIADADQAIGTVVMTYPVNQDNQIDVDLLKQKKYTNFFIWKLSSKKFKKIESSYVDARNDNRYTIDLKVTLDGDPKYQKQQIEAASTPVWLREDFDPEVRNWILDQGLRAWKHVQNNLGFEMSKEKLIEKLSGGGSSGGNESTEAPRLVQGYADMID